MARKPDQVKLNSHLYFQDLSQTLSQWLQEHWLAYAALHTCYCNKTFQVAVTGIKLEVSEF